MDDLGSTNTQNIQAQYPPHNMPVLGSVSAVTDTVSVPQVDVTARTIEQSIDQTNYINPIQSTQEAPSHVEIIPDAPAPSQVFSVSSVSQFGLNDQPVPSQNMESEVPKIPVATQNYQQSDVKQENTADIDQNKTESSSATDSTITFHTETDANPNLQKIYSEPRHKNKSAVKGLFKMVLLFAIPLITVGITGTVLITTAKERTYEREKEVLITVPMKNVNWQDLGNVFEPVIDLPVKTVTSYENWEFLIDSGAVISSLPNDWAQKTGQDLAFMKRSTFRGFGGKTSFAYQGEMKVRLGEEDVVLPVVFTEASGTKSLLGRKGFFENYSLYFNHKEKRIEIRK